MKKYIILTGAIGAMGGAEMFTNNKCQYLKSQGWETAVYFFLNRPIIIKELEEYKDNYIYELQYGYYYWSKKQRNAIIDRMCSGLTENDTVIVESQLLNLTFWGELMAEKIGAKHILNCMEEYIRPLTPKEALFLDFKIKRREILNAAPKRLKMYFGDKMKDEYLEYLNPLNLLCSNVLTDDDTIEIPEIDKNAMSILSIGRLDKPYIIPMLDEILSFVGANKERTFNFVVVGGSPDGTIEKRIETLFASVENVNVHQCGYMFPVPTKLLNKIDTAIASANSILVAADYGIPTIAVDTKDYKALGVYGYTTTEKFIRNSEPVQSIADLLHQILILKKYPRKSPGVASGNQLEEVFKPQLEYALSTRYPKEAYDVMSIQSRPKQFVANAKRLILRCFWGG